ncbi:LysM peptidoglycan-binding domain-containing protein [Niallia sp. 01092]|uniref:LysM peptidoglycan-binding domain-containing protein n=1 Tax=unclassified Niallia TaxID=2837522 RepID=UPI003FCF4BC6
MKKKVTTLATAAVISTAFTSTASASTYVVQKGDSLNKIAKKYNTTVQKLKSSNNLSTDTIFINQKLTITNSSNKTIQQASVSTDDTNNASSATTYTIVSGDTLLKIANKYSISLAELKQWNNINSDVIYPGNVLVVSKPATVSSNTNTDSSNETSTNNRENQGIATDNSSTYTIKSGDTLGKIASAYNLSLSQLKQLNNLTSDLIFPGQQLKVSPSDSNPPVSIENKEQKIEQQKQPSFISNPTNTDPASFETTVLTEAQKMIGTPYSWGGTTSAGFDCSGFVYYVYSKAGKPLNRLSTSGYYDRSYYVDFPKVGDLVFFKNTYKEGISHLGIYIGNNSFIHADSSKGVRITSLDNAYFKDHFASFKRFY